MFDIIEIRRENFRIQLWGKDMYQPQEELLHELPMSFQNSEEAWEFAHRLRNHFDYTSDLCWVEVVADNQVLAHDALNDKFRTKASKVAQAYDDAMMDGVSSEGCYTLAVMTARELGGVEIANSNDDNSSTSFAPSVTFEFDDLSFAQVTYGSVFL